MAHNLRFFTSQYAKNALLRGLCTGGHAGNLQKPEQGYSGQRCAQQEAAAGSHSSLKHVVEQCRFPSIRRANQCHCERPRICRLRHVTDQSAHADIHRCGWWQQDTALLASDQTTRQKRARAYSHTPSPESCVARVPMRISIAVEWWQQETPLLASDQTTGQMRVRAYSHTSSPESCVAARCRRAGPVCVDQRAWVHVNHKHRVGLATRCAAMVVLCSHAIAWHSVCMCSGKLR